MILSTIQHLDKQQQRTLTTVVLTQAPALNGSCIYNNISSMHAFALKKNKNVPLRELNGENIYGVTASLGFTVLLNLITHKFVHQKL